MGWDIHGYPPRSCFGQSMCVENTAAYPGSHLSGTKKGSGSFRNISCIDAPSCLNFKTANQITEHAMMSHIRMQMSHVNDTFVHVCYAINFDWQSHVSNRMMHKLPDPILMHVKGGV